MDNFIEIEGTACINLGDEKLIDKAIYGSFSFSLCDDDSFHFIESVYREAQVKYHRMHYDDKGKRFDKSWTGKIGEEIAKVALQKHLQCIIISHVNEMDSHGYDGGDIHFQIRGKQYICNVSSRKLSLNDELKNVLINPHNYFTLIPVDQFNQYTTKSDLAYFVFILFDKDSISHFQIDDISLEVFLSGKWIIPGYLKSSDLRKMLDNSYLYTKKKGTSINGLFSDLTYNITMYTDNYVIFCNMLRSFKIL